MPDPALAAAPDPHDHLGGVVRQRGRDHLVLEGADLLAGEELLGGRGGEGALRPAAAAVDDGHPGDRAVRCEQ